MTLKTSHSMYMVKCQIRVSHKFFEFKGGPYVGKIVCTGRKGVSNFGQNWEKERAVWSSLV